ncbi:MAG: hypothetical protein ABIH21_03175 [Patescibacteria group bacterium]
MNEKIQEIPTEYRFGDQEVDPNEVDIDLENATPMQHVEEVFREAGLDAKKIQIADAGPFTEAVVVNKKGKKSDEMTVRVYRGVGELNKTLLEHKPYAMRVVKESGGIEVIPELEEPVKELAEDPTYEKYLEIYGQLKPRLRSDSERRNYADDLTNLEDDILRGYPFRKALRFQQHNRNGGIADAVLAPYISLSSSPDEAIGYARTGGGVMVLDVPISQLEDFGDTKGETALQGSLNPEYITAIIPEHKGRTSDPDKRVELVGQLHVAIDAVTKESGVEMFDEDEVDETRKVQSTEHATEHADKWQKDIALVREKRSKSLVADHKDAGLDYETMQAAAREFGNDVYTQTKEAIYDFYADKFKHFGRRGKEIEGHTFQIGSSEEQKIDRNNITDEMLTFLKGWAERREKIEQIRSK